MEVQPTRASAVIVQHVPVAATERFLAWQNGVTQVAEQVAGYRGTDLYPPVPDQRDEWVAVIHFDSPQALQGWLDSPVRAEWIHKLPREIGDFRVKSLPGGFGPWFSGLLDGAKPPGWKMALTVLFGLYPTVMLLAFLVGPPTKPLGLAFAMLVSNALSVPLLQWVVMPILNRLLGPWLGARPGIDRTLTLLGTAGLVIGLLAMALAFRQVQG